MFEKVKIIITGLICYLSLLGHSQERFVKHDASLKAINEALFLLNQSIQNNIPGGSLYIGGSCPKRLIQLALKSDFYFNKTLEEKYKIGIRDIDMQLLFESQVNWKEFKKALKEFNAFYPTAKIRVIPEGAEIKVGGLDLDITSYSEKKELLNRGVFNIDLIKIRLDSSLEFALRQINKLGYKGALKQNIISDPKTAYFDFLQSKYEITNDQDIEYEKLALRAVRTAAKLGLNTPPKNVERQLAEIKKNIPQGEFSTKSFTKGFLKVLGDESGHVQLKWLAKFGVLNDWSKELAKKINLLNLNELNKLFKTNGVKETDPFVVYKRLLMSLSNESALTLASYIVKINFDLSKKWTNEIIEKQSELKSLRSINSIENNSKQGAVSSCQKIFM